MTYCCYVVLWFLCLLWCLIILFIIPYKSIFGFVTSMFYGQCAAAVFRMLTIILLSLPAPNGLHIPRCQPLDNL